MDLAGASALPRRMLSGSPALKQSIRVTFLPISRAVFFLLVIQSSPVSFQKKLKHLILLKLIDLMSIVWYFHLLCF